LLKIPKIYGKLKDFFGFVILMKLHGKEFNLNFKAFYEGDKNFGIKGKLFKE